MKRRQPDLMAVLIVVVISGVLLTMGLQAGEPPAPTQTAMVAP